ncbi:MAG: T9SS type A sorting domain-containing protein [Sphingobacteriaceae bacterium]|nr:T9SS type A sorting domain-containing protein [Sphingobacteriaceae bacterium]
MRFLLLLYISLFTGLTTFAQANLALTATATASASSTGNFGPANWTDGILNGSFFGWVGTASNFPQPAWMQLEWTQPQLMNRMVLHNVGTNFAPPAGNAVVFAGSAQLQYWDGSSWQNIQLIQGIPGYGSQLIVDFNQISTTRLRLHQFALSGSAQNPGFDEWQVFRVQQDTSDAAIDSIRVTNLQGGTGRILRFTMRIQNEGNIPLVNPTVSYTINTNPVSGPFNATFIASILPGGDSSFVHPHTVPAEAILNGRELCAWVVAVGDSNRLNDTLCVTLAGIGISVLEPKLADLVVYPNPLQDVLYFKQLPAGSILRFFDAQGSCLVVLSETPESFPIPANWPSGLYFLQIQDKNTQRTIRLQRP